MQVIALKVKRNGEWKTWTYERYVREVELAARGFIHVGMSRHRSVAIIGQNSPEWVISDNGRQFASREFNEFLTERGIQPRKTSPYYPQSNGLSESGVKIAKNLLTKCGGKMDKFDNALSSWRDVPNCSGKSPYEMFLARRTRVGIPMLPGKTSPNVQAVEEGAETRKIRRGEHY